jgi:hypothetical protein
MDRPRLTSDLATQTVEDIHFIQTPHNSLQKRKMSVKINSTIFVGGGNLLKATHDSKVLKLPANFNIFLPPVALGKSPKKVPVLFYLCKPLHQLFTYKDSWIDMYC